FHDVVERLFAGRKIVIDHEFVLGNADEITGVEHFLCRQFVAVDFDAVLAVVVLNNPTAILERQLAMQTRNIREAEANVAGIAPTDGQALMEQGNHIPASPGNEAAKFAHETLDNNDV